jgi:hypothetical protein
LAISTFGKVQVKIISTISTILAILISVSCIIITQYLTINDQPDSDDDDNGEKENETNE